MVSRHHIEYNAVIKHSYYTEDTFICLAHYTNTMTDFKIGKTSDSKSLSKIDGKPFTITAVEDSNYEDNGEITQGVKITTKETFTIDGTKANKFHTTRDVIVKRLREDDVAQALEANGAIGPLVCQKATGKKYFVLSDA